jgi:hypothetical protein
VEIVLTDQITRVVGQVSDENRRPIADGTVLVFPERATDWGEDSRRVRAVRPDTRGQYQVTGLPPGDYLAVAIEYVEAGLWNDPEYLESIRRYGQALTLGEAETRNLPLTLVRP